jgi:hypothetical protein
VLNKKEEEKKNLFQITCDKIANIDLVESDDTEFHPIVASSERD